MEFFWGVLIGFLINFINYYNENFAGRIKLLSYDGTMVFEVYSEKTDRDDVFIVRITGMKGGVAKFPYVDYNNAEKSMELYVSKEEGKKILELANAVKISKRKQDKSKMGDMEKVFIDGKIYRRRYYNDKGDMETFTEVEDLHTYLYRYMEIFCNELNPKYNNQYSNSSYQLKSVLFQ